MNNIYKVIWSKAKNCYVVASEIARSHTKSASGSEKIGGGTRRKLLASLMALSLLCGGLGVASATLEVVNQNGTAGTTTIYTKEEVDNALKEKGLATDVATNKANIAKLQEDVGNATSGLTQKVTEQGEKIATNTADIGTNKDNIKLLQDKKLDITTASATYATRDALNTLQTAVNDKVDESTLTTALDDKANTDLSNLTAAGETKIKETMSEDMEKKANKDTVTALVGRVGGLETTVGGASGGLVKGVADLNAKTTKISYDAATDTTSVNGMKVGQQVDMGGKDIINARALTATGKVTGDGVDAGTGAITGGSLTVTGKVTGNGVDAGPGDITTTGNVKGGTLETTGNATIGGALSATGKVTGDGVEAGTGAITGGSLTVTGKVTGNGVDAGPGDITTTGNVKGGTLETTGNATIGGALSATGKVTGDGVEAGTGAITGGSLTVTGKVTGNGVDAGAGAITGGSLSVTGDTNLGKTTVTGDLKVTGTITTDKMIFGDPATGNYTEINKGNITSKNAVLAGDATLKSSSMELDHSKLEVAVADKDSNGHLTMTADKTSIKNSDLAGKNYSEIVADKDSVRTTVKDEKDNTTSTKSSATEIRNYAKDAAGNKTNNVQTATQNKSWAKDKDGNESSIVQTGKDITNTAQNGTITNDAQNIVNNATGDMTNTVGGKLTTTVTGKVTENYKAGQATNVTGDQDITVSGTQTTTATDIKRNASSGMIDTIDNDYGTNTETKVAGETKTEVSIKGTDEKGEYIRGATQSRDYLIKGTLKNSETKTAEATSSEVTDGTNKASTIQDAKNLAGSVTNGTETGISGIHANNDGSVSIDSIVVGGGMSSVINQKKDSIQSAVGDGTNSTVIRQDKDNVAIASSNGTVAIAGKDIVNNASNSITDKVRDNTRVTTSTSITDTVGTANRKIENGKIIDTADDSTVTTENGKGTTFTKTGSTAYSTAAGAPTDTNIAGNHITTGRVDANELGVSDKDGANTADFSVEAGERKGVKASAGNGTTTGSLDVTAEEVSSSVKDASGKGSTFKQRIDAIMMESKEVSIKAEETLTNEAKVITNKASEVINNEAVNINNTATGIINSKASEIKNQADKLISNKVGENTSEYMEDGKITTSVKDGAKSTVTIQNADGLQTGVTNGTSTNASATTATSSAQTIASGNKANSVITTIDGTQFVNTDAAVPVTGASGDGTHLNTTIKGNTITTGKVTLDYADVMKDLGVRGNATVDHDLTVKGITNTKTLNVTEDANVGRDLAVGGNATITGDVTANSYKVGGKTYIDANGINANNQKITNVADGSISEGSKDAVNGGQLYTVKNDLEGKVNKVGANAAAMANLHPMEFDPDSKWNIAAAIGNYGSETAAALGAFYRPNDDVMVNLSTAFGTGENMVGGGVSVRLGKGGNKLSREETNALKDQVNDLTARMDALLSVLNPNMSKDFPDVPENHWAYEAVSRLAGNDIVQGYPDGEFHGERTMTRYEMAEIIYNALSRGAEAEKELVEEFKPELQAMAASEKATAERAEG